MPVNEESVGVALIWHDDETSQIGYQSFDDFVVVRFLETFANLDHHVDNNFSKEEISQCVKSDVLFVTKWMKAPMQHYLRSFCTLPLIPRVFHYGPKSRPQNVLSFISQEQLEIERAKFSSPDIAPFTTVARWEINPPLQASAALASNPMPPEGWRTYAANPKQKLLAIQSYRQEFCVSLTEAKAAIDQYIENVAKNT